MERKRFMLNFKYVLCCGEEGVVQGFLSLSTFVLFKCWQWTSIIFVIENKIKQGHILYKGGRRDWWENLPLSGFPDWDQPSDPTPWHKQRGRNWWFSLRSSSAVSHSMGPSCPWAFLIPRPVTSVYTWQWMTTNKSREAVAIRSEDGWQSHLWAPSCFLSHNW